MDRHHTLSGAMVCRLMRKHKVTISGLAAKHNITQKRVREVRAKGVTGFLALEWCYLISGIWPDSQQHAQPCASLRAGLIEIHCHPCSDSRQPRKSPPPCPA